MSPPQLRAVADKTNRALPCLALLRARQPGGRTLRVFADAAAGGCDHQFTRGYGRGSGSLEIQALPESTGFSGGRKLTETKATAGALHERRRGSFHGAPGSGSASLHAKTFAFDRRVGFVGSYNLDPRSSRLNTEMGVIFDCPTLAKSLPVKTERDIDRNAYRVELSSGTISNG